jgi:hypothetical protein
VYEYYVNKPDEEVWYWVSPEIRVDASLFKGKEASARANFLTEGLRGAIPLKTVRKWKRKSMIITVTATEIRPMELTRNDFRFPSHYEVYGYDWRR